jgi:hypothetical protein
LKKSSAIRDRRATGATKASAALLGLLVLAASAGLRARKGQKDPAVPEGPRATSESPDPLEEVFGESPDLVVLRGLKESEARQAYKEMLDRVGPLEYRGSRGLRAHPVYRGRRASGDRRAIPDPVADAGLSGLHRDVNTSFSSSRILGLSSTQMGR